MVGKSRVSGSVRTKFFREGGSGMGWRTISCRWEPGEASRHAGHMQTLGMKGAAATILWLLLFSDRPLTVEEMARRATHDSEGIRLAANYLERQGAVENGSSQGWRLTRDFLGLVARSLETRARCEPPAMHGETERTRLVAILRKIGIRSPALERLAQRPELQAEPEVVTAWWWYFLTQAWPTNRQGLVIRSLDERRPPPADFLALARLWPLVEAEDRNEMRQLIWRTCPPSQLAAYFAESYPQMTPVLMETFLTLYRTAPGELGF